MPKRIISCLCLFPLLFSLIGCKDTSSAETQGLYHTVPTEATTESTVNETSDTTPTQPETEPTQGETEPQPTEPEVIPDNIWTPLCNEYIYLRSQPGGGETLSEIPLGEHLTFEQWSGKYALVTYNGMQGYVSANYIMPADEAYFAKRLQVISPTCQYSYQQLLTDIEALQERYPGLVHRASIGESELGREIPVIKIGNPNAKRQVLMQGAIHGREYFTAWLLMAIADHSLAEGYLSGNDICYHIIPMSNPDGVTLSQTMQLNDTQAEIYQSDLNLEYTTYDSATYAKKWKSNALGIDLNRNFPSGWSESWEHPLPSSERYRGGQPLCAAESAALAEYTLDNSFDATVSFHSHGSVIYYRYGNKEPVNSLSFSFAKAIAQITGYTPIQYDGTTGAGYKDWAMDELGIPSLTLEIGSFTTPLETRDMYNTFARFENLLPAIDQWLQA
ncbi:MAG: hypothetical protein E7421_04620 [Ruminococcaceae bacterium]|nr:hypothetical protein [Oscillospiraceae bacterium]